MATCRSGGSASRFSWLRSTQLKSPFRYWIELTGSLYSMRKWTCFTLAASALAEEYTRPERGAIRAQCVSLRGLHRRPCSRPDAWGWMTVFALFTIATTAALVIYACRRFDGSGCVCSLAQKRIDVDGFHTRLHCGSLDVRETTSVALIAATLRIILALRLYSRENHRERL